jgi:hypothetical protein
MVLGFESEPCACKADVLPLKPTLFSIHYFSDRVSCFCNPPTFLVAEITRHMPPCLDLRGGLTNFFAWAGFKQQSSQSLPPGSWDYRHAPSRPSYLYDFCFSDLLHLPK